MVIAMLHWCIRILPLKVRRIYVDMYVCICVYMYLCVYVCMYVCIYVYMYISCHQDEHALLRCGDDELLSHALLFERNTTLRRLT